MDAGMHKMSMADYQRDPAPAPSLSSHGAQTLLTQSCKHAWFGHPRLNPDYQREDNSTFDLGSCSHAVLLEGEESIAVIDADDWRKNTAKEARDEARAQGRIPVLAGKMDAIRAMASAARIALKECEWGTIDLSAGQAEQVLIWQEDKAWCRARPDWMSADRKLLLDYKSTAGSANPSAWIRTQMMPMGFDLQAAHYLRGNEQTGGPASAQWIFLVQENYPPFECAFVGLSPAMEEIAERKWQDALSLWKNCMQSDRWGGYTRRVHFAEPMPWQIAEHEERTINFDDASQA